MTQDEINRQEWSNPENWSEGVIRTYFSKSDSRVLVRPLPLAMRQQSQQRRAGILPISGGLDLCVNLGHKRGILFLLALFAIPTIFLFAAFVCVLMSKK